MEKSTFKVQKMDCPSEEGMIKFKLSQHPNISSMHFDIPNRELVIYHIDGLNEILSDLKSLNFGASLLSTQTVEGFHAIDNSKSERRLLWQVLAINLFFFALEVWVGITAHSMGLIADGFDMLSDSIVYALALFVVGKSAAKKNSVANISGYFQMLLAVLGLIEVIRRFFGVGEAPNFQLMIFISVLALAGNAACLYLLQKSKSNESHMKASMIFTSNDVIVNLGVILAGALVFFTRNKLPDLVIGSIVFVLVFSGALRILKLSKKTKSNV